MARSALLLLALTPAALAWQLAEPGPPELPAGLVRYVDDSAPAGGTGTSWANAYRYLQDALQKAALNPAITNIRIAGGRYTPDRDSVGMVTPNDPEATFGLRGTIALIGGYRGAYAGGGSPGSRNPALWPSVLSGDLAGNDDLNMDGVRDYSDFTGLGMPRYGTFLAPYDNSLNVVTVAPGASAIMYGLTVSGGNAFTGSVLRDRGGGVRVDTASLTIYECTIQDNQANNSGGGVFAIKGNVLIERSLLRRNPAGTLGGGVGLRESTGTIAASTIERCAASRGGGVGHDVSGRLRISGSDLSINYAPGAGGALWILSSSQDALRIEGARMMGNRADVGGAVATFVPAAIKLSVFAGNTAQSVGGAIDVKGTLVELASCGFFGNIATDTESFGGAIYGNAEMTSCVLTGNEAAYGGGVYFDYGPGNAVRGCTFWANHASRWGGGAWTNEDMPIANSIFWENSAVNGTLEEQQIGISFAAVPIDSCIVQGWSGAYEGVGSFSADPLFVSPAGVDGLAGTEDDDLRLGFLSPAINAGSNALLPADTLDLDGDGDTAETLPMDMDLQARVVGGVVDIGAYESLNPGLRAPARGRRLTPARW